jgi:hypothetical protein
VADPQDGMTVCAPRPPFLSQGVGTVIGVGARGLTASSAAIDGWDLRRYLALDADCPNRGVGHGRVSCVRVRLIGVSR